MEIIAYLIIPIIGSLFIYGSLFYGMYQMGGMDENQKETSWWIAVVYTIVSVLISLLGNGLFNLCYMLLAPFISYKMFHTRKNHIIYYFILIAAVFITDGAVVVGFQFLQLQGLSFFNAIVLDQILINICVRMIEFIVIQAVVFIVRKYTGLYMTGRQAAISLLLPLFSLFNMFSLLYFCQIYFTKEMILLFLVNLVLLISVNIYFTILIHTMSKNNYLENEKNLYRQQAKMQFQYYEREEAKYKEVRKLIHDIRNHIQIMEELYKNNSNNAVEYAGEIHQILNNFDHKYYTSDKLLNIILNDKAQLMQEFEIKADIKVSDLSLDFMKDLDVTILFTNLLDNSIEAAKESREPFIKLRVNMVHQFLSVSAENSCDREPIHTNKGLRSRKVGHDGLGIKNMKEVIEQFGGDMNYEWKDGVFYTKIMLTAAKKN